MLGNQNKSPNQPLIDFCFWEKFRVRFRGCTRPRCSERSEARTRWRRPSPCTCRCASSSEGCTSSCCRCEPAGRKNQDSCVGLSHIDPSLVMAPRTSLGRLPSIRDSFAVRQVMREWLVSPSVVLSHVRAVAKNDELSLRQFDLEKNVSPVRLPKQFLDT